MNLAASIRDALAGVDPNLPWIVLWLATFAACWAVRRFLPGAWRVFFAPLISPDAPVVLRRTVQGLVVSLPGAILAAVAEGGNIKHAVLGLVWASLAPLTHHLLRAAPVPYQGELGGGSEPE